LKHLKKILLIILLAIILPTNAVFANTASEHNAETEDLDVREFILHHVGDAYEWHITNFGNSEWTIPLPVIVYSQKSGLNVFLSSKIHHSAEYKGFSVAHEGKYEGKIVEQNDAGEEIRPFDISITKNVLSLLMSGALLIFIVIFLVRSYEKNGFGVQKGFAGMMELFIMNINDDVIKPCVGKDYKKFAPYLLTLFFFVLLNNLLGLIPIFPGGANVTGNIAITGVLAVVTFLIVNISGSREYWKEIFWPDVPLWLKVPPMLPIIELVGIFTKPFALMIRLFANILAGHSIVLGLTCLIFVTVKLGAAGNITMTGVSIFFSIFIAFVELLVAYIQAYIFTMLSAVFIGLARVEPHHKH
jgi:F-type H+-transporting ATPase subunit a